MGIIRRNRFIEDGTYSCEGDRQTDPPSAIHGGWDGLVASCRKNPDTSAEEILDAKVTGIPFAPGEFIEFREPNAAGYGDPLDRPVESVRDDVLDGFATVAIARDAYGVVFETDKPVTLDRIDIDGAATEKLRAEMRVKRGEGSLTGYYEGHELPPASAPVSVASNTAFGML